MINESPDEPLPSSTPQEDDEDGPRTAEDNLEEFRSQWEEELKGYKSSYKKRSESGEKTDASKDDESAVDYARRLFLEGAELEKRGDPFKAMALYRRAVLLVPEIEHIIYETNKKSRKNKANMENLAVQMQNDLNVIDSGAGGTDATEGEEKPDLIALFEDELVSRNGKFIERPGEGNVIVTSKHISDLPMEIILYLMKWIVSSDLDLKSLESASNVCKGFYLCSRDKEIWRLICFKIWGFNVGTLEDSPYTSWHEMYLNRSHVLFHGCYISRTTYLRNGENNFQDKYHQTLQMVVYYRYLKFFPDGTVTILTTADEPHKCVNRLKHRYPTHNDISLGHYRIVNDTIIIVVKRSKTTGDRSRIYNCVSGAGGGTGDLVCNMEFTIFSTKKRKFVQLQWKSYQIVQNGYPLVYELTNALYPPLQFSRIKSYQSEAIYPLQ